MSWPVDEHVLRNQLAVVLVWCEHISFYPHRSSFGGEGANYIVGLEAVTLEYGDVECGEQFLYNRYREFYVLGSFFPLCLVFRKSFVAECLPMVESYSNMRGVFFVDDFVQGIAKAQNGRCVHTFGVDTRRADECVICPIDEGVGI